MAIRSVIAAYVVVPGNVLVAASVELNQMMRLDPIFLSDSDPITARRRVAELVSFIESMQEK